MSGSHVAVVGAGIIGTNIAVALRRRGRRVTLIDALAPGEKTSAGNAGCIATAEVAPVSLPGLVWQVPGMLADPLGPLSIRWRYLPWLAPWLVRFLLASRSERVNAIAAALAQLLNRVWDDYLPVLAEAGLSYAVRRQGCLYVYESEAGFQQSAFEWDLRRRHGIPHEIVDPTRIAELEPHLAPIFTRGVFLPDWGHVADPQAIVKGLAAHARALGAEIRQAEVRTVIRSGSGPSQLLLADGTALAFDQLVIAAGAWSKKLAAAVDHAVPLDTERGYNTTLPHSAGLLNRPIAFGEKSFVATPLGVGLRVGGAVELAGTEAPPNYARSKALLALARRALPNLDDRDGREWMGCRPSMPDSLPVISGSPRHPNVFFAFGHGHLGLTEGATTGRLIADLATGVAPPIDVTPYRIDRF